MKIMVFDVPAESGGALSVLNEFYSEYKNDKKNNYIFVISKPELEETENIRVLRFPWVKKSWMHRLYFDNIIAPKLIQKYAVDEVFSLQNIIVPNTKVWQTVYVHNSLPFSDYRFSFTENRLLWIYQNILSKSIYKSIKKANKVIVQTEWMKKAVIEKLKIDDSRITVLPPKIEIEIKRSYKRTKEDLTTFFYPASAVGFKNHKTVVEACLKLKEAGITNYEVIFTIEGNENKNIADLNRIVKENKLPITFIGSLTREQVFNYYSKTVLLFPSYIETVGLPLIEAKMHQTPIIASDCGFSREILFGYRNSCFFDPFDSEKLAVLLKDLII